MTTRSRLTNPSDTTPLGRLRPVSSDSTPTRGRGRPSIPSILTPVLDSDGIAAYEVTGKIPMNDDRLTKILVGLDKLRPHRDHDALVEQYGGKTYVVVNDDTALD